MPVLDEEGFALQEYDGKQVRSNFWNQISPKIRSMLEDVDGFHVGIGDWHYYVKEILKNDGSYFVVYKNPNFKKILEPSEKPYEDEYMTVDSPTTRVIGGTHTESDRHIDIQTKVGKAELKPRNDLLSVTESLIIPTNLFAEYVSIIIIRKNANIQIPEMYSMIKTINDISILGIKRDSFTTVTVRDVFGTG